MFRINLPNPRHMPVSDFFVQMRIVLKAAERAYEEAEKSKETEEDNNPWVSFRLSEKISEEIEGTEEITDMSEDDWQNISLVVERL